MMHLIELCILYYVHVQYRAQMSESLIKRLEADDKNTSSECSQLQVGEDMIMRIVETDPISTLTNSHHGAEGHKRKSQSASVQG